MPDSITLTPEQAKAIVLAYAELYDCLYDSDLNVSRLGKKWSAELFDSMCKLDKALDALPSLSELPR